MRHGWLKYFGPFRDLETNPHTQLRVHIWGQRFWMANVPVFIFVFIKYPQEFLALGVLVTGLYSLYANWATDNGAASAIRAELNTRPTNKQIMTEVRQRMG